MSIEFNDDLANGWKEFSEEGKALNYLAQVEELMRVEIDRN